MEIRPARVSDFEAYKHFYYSRQCDMLYRPDKDEIKPQRKTPNARTYFGELDEETKKRIDDEIQRTLKKFKKTISENYSRIYIFEEKEIIVGYAELFQCDGERWKLVYCFMSPEYQSPYEFMAVIDKLLKMPNIKVLDVCVLYDSCKRRMESAGFTPIGGGFYRKSVSKEKAG